MASSPCARFRHPYKNPQKRQPEPDTSRNTTAAFFSGRNEQSANYTFRFNAPLRWKTSAVTRNLSFCARDDFNSSVAAKDFDIQSCCCNSTRCTAEQVTGHIFQLHLRFDSQRTTLTLLLVVETVLAAAGKSLVLEN
jgi:hypothetical protein